MAFSVNRSSSASESSLGKESSALGTWLCQQESRLIDDAGATQDSRACPVTSPARPTEIIGRKDKAVEDFHSLKKGCLFLPILSVCLTEVVSAGLPLLQEQCCNSGGCHIMSGGLTAPRPLLSALPGLHCQRDALSHWRLGLRQAALRALPGTIPARAAVVQCRSRPAQLVGCRSTLRGAQLLRGERALHTHTMKRVCEITALLGEA